MTFTLATDPLTFLMISELECECRWEDLAPCGFANVNKKMTTLDPSNWVIGYKIL